MFLDGEIYISVSAKDKSGLLDLRLDNPSVEFDIDNLPPPFIPRFEFLLKKDTSGSAPFSFKRKEDPANNKATFDFSLAIQAKTGINQTISMPWL